MAASLDTLQARRDALLAAMASGVLTIRHGESLTTYRSLEEMERALALLDAQIDQANSVRRYRSVRVYPKDGW
ncbi:phage head-tail joining protein [Alsobacter sp. R-9]